MVKIIEGNMLDSDAPVIVQQVNCMGVMGAGLALQIKRRYPHVFPAYKSMCSSYLDNGKLQELLGCVQAVRVKENQVLYNIFGQSVYGNHRYVRYTSYDALIKGFKTINEECAGLTIAIPYGIGCGLGAGDWTKVYNIITQSFTSCTVEIYKLPKK